MGHVSSFTWNTNESSQHLAIAPDHAVSIVTIDDCSVTQQPLSSEAWNYPTELTASPYLTEREQEIQAHMSYPSFIAENQNWMASRQAIPLGFPTSVEEQQPLNQQTMSPPKMPRTHSRIPSGTFALNELDPSTTVAMINNVYKEGRQARLVVD